MRKRRILLLEHLLEGDARGRTIEVGLLNRRRLLEQGVGVKIVWDQRRAFGGVFCNKVAAYGTALVEFKTIVILQSAVLISHDKSRWRTKVLTI